MGTEEQILRDIKDGKKEAKRRLYDRYSGMAMSVCMRYMGNRDDAADVLQETFIKVLTRIGEVSYRGEGTLKSWILRVTINEALTALRRKVYFDDVHDEYDSTTPRWLSNGVQHVRHGANGAQGDSTATGYRRQFVGITTA